MATTDDRGFRHPRTLAGIEELVPGFTAAVDLLDEAWQAEDTDPYDLPESFREWFEGNDRWAMAYVRGDGFAEVIAYESTGGYCDSWRRIPGVGWLHVESGRVLEEETGRVREATEAELDRAEALSESQ